jgi:hypothetical protein
MHKMKKYFLIFLFLFPFSVFGADNLSGVLFLQDQKTSGTNGGSSVSGLQFRSLNTILENSIIGASLDATSTGLFTLPPGLYFFSATAPAVLGVEQISQLVLWSSTTNATTTFGSNLGRITVSGINAIHNDTLFGSFFLSATSSLLLRHYIGAGLANIGLGAAKSKGIEVYSSLFIQQFSSSTDSGGGDTYYSTTTADLSALDSAVQDLFYGFIIFFESMFFVIWLLDKKKIK